MLTDVKLRVPRGDVAAAIDDELRQAVAAYVHGNCRIEQLDATVSLYNEIVFRLQRRLALAVPLWEALISVWVEAEEAGADDAEWRRRLAGVLDQRRAAA